MRKHSSKPISDQPKGFEKTIWQPDEADKIQLVGFGGWLPHGRKIATPFARILTFAEVSYFAF
jgi:hypothetical protein